MFKLARFLRLWEFIWKNAKTFPQENRFLQTTIGSLKFKPDSFDLFEKFLAVFHSITAYNAY